LSKRSGVFLSVKFVAQRRRLDMRRRVCSPKKKCVANRRKTRHNKGVLREKRITNKSIR
jgi:hypothetical protein